MRVLDNSLDNDFFPSTYSTFMMSRKLKIAEITPLITQRYKAIYKLLMDNAWPKIVNQLIEIDFELFHSQFVMALTVSYDVK